MKKRIKDFLVIVVALIGSLFFVFIGYSAMMAPSDPTMKQYILDHAVKLPSNSEVKQVEPGGGGPLLR